MKHLIEKISILALSTMLVSTFAVSPAIPQMLAHFAAQGIGQGQVEFLMTVTSFAIMFALLANPIVTRFFSERTIMVLGLLLIALGGAMPVLFPVFGLVFLSRLLLGIGIGLINARAINIVGTHFSGKERMQMMGLRGSAEVLGSATLTILVGWLIGFGWQAAFLVYLFGFVLLALFLLFVPKDEEAGAELVEEDVTDIKLTPQMWRTGIFLAFLAFFVINVNTFITIRIPTMVVDQSLGTAREASWILGTMQIMGIVAGAVFAFLVERLKNWLLPISYVLFGLAVLGIAFSINIWMLAIGAMVSGFFYSIVLTIVFSRVTVHTPKALLSAVMTIVLMGCNIGGATASILPNFLENLNPGSTGAFGVYAFACALISLGLIVRQFLIEKQARNL